MFRFMFRILMTLVVLSLALSSINGAADLANMPVPFAVGIGLMCFFITLFISLWLLGQIWRKR